jgi:hypothetical protein
MAPISDRTTGTEPVCCISNETAIPKVYATASGSILIE